MSLFAIIFFVLKRAEDIFVLDIVMSLPSFLPSRFLTCYAILPTLFGGKGPHLRRWLIAQPLHQTVSWLRFSGFFLGSKANARRSVHSPRIISLSPLSLVTDATLGEKWPFVRNPDRSWCLKVIFFFWPQPMAPWTTGVRITSLIDSLFSKLTNRFSYGACDTFISTSTLNWHNLFW